MKKIILVVVLGLVAVSVLSTGVAYAQGIGNGPVTANGEGPLHDYIIKAYADALGLTVDALEARLANGEPVYQVALSQGIAADQIPTLLAGARAKAFDAAVAAGVITTDQAAWMKSRGNQGAGLGPCNGTGQPAGGMRHGNGASGFGPGVMRGGRWQQSNP